MNLPELGITINQIFRYGYGGFLVFLATAVVSPDLTERVVRSLGGGGIFLTIVAFATGGIVYVFYRPFVNNLMIDGMHRGLHRRLEGFWGYRVGKNARVGYNCKLHYLEDRYQVLPKVSLDAFRSVRDALFEPERRDRFELNHSENHLLGMTFLVLAIFTFVTLLQGRFAIAGVFAAIAICALALEAYSSIFICRRECRYLMTLDPERVGEVLRKAELA